MGIFQIFGFLKELFGIAKPYIDQKEKAKAATGDAMKASATADSPSIGIQDEIDWLKDELQKDIDQEKGSKNG